MGKRLSKTTQQIVQNQNDNKIHYIFISLSPSLCIHVMRRIQNLCWIFEMGKAIKCWHCGSDAPIPPSYQLIFASCSNPRQKPLSDLAQNFLISTLTHWLVRSQLLFLSSGAITLLSLLFSFLIFLPLLNPEFCRDAPDFASW